MQTIASENTIARSRKKGKEPRLEEKFLCSWHILSPVVWLPRSPQESGAFAKVEAAVISKAVRGMGLPVTVREVLGVVRLRLLPSSLVSLRLSGRSGFVLSKCLFLGRLARWLLSSASVAESGSVEVRPDLACELMCIWISVASCPTV